MTLDEAKEKLISRYIAEKDAGIRIYMKEWNPMNHYVSVSRILSAFNENPDRELVAEYLYETFHMKMGSWYWRPDKYQKAGDWRITGG